MAAVFSVFGDSAASKKIGQSAGGFFRTRRKRGAKRQAFCGRSPVFLRGALRVTVRRAAFAAANFSACGGKGRKAASLLRAQPVFFPWGFAGYGSPSRLCGGRIFFARCGKGRKAASLLRAQPVFSPWGFAGYGSPSRLCGGRIFPHGAEKGAKRQAFCGAARFFFVGLCGLRFTEPPLRRADFSAWGGKGRTAERRAGFGFIPKRIKRNSGNYSLASSGSKRLCRLRKSRQSGREKIAVSATCGAITV